MGLKKEHLTSVPQEIAVPQSVAVSVSVSVSVSDSDSDPAKHQSVLVETSLKPLPTYLSLEHSNTCN